jgi:hypothetical protein
MPVEHALTEASLRTQSAAAAVQPFGPAAQSSTDAQHSIPDPELSAAFDVCNPTGVSSGQNHLLGAGAATPVLHVLKSRSHGVASPHEFGPLEQSPAVR